ncbi:MAG: hypothetical protein B7Z62_08900 [Deltaproteobacteria bacterium 37-65-8]|nr:MAG: hypothetical protein B7Z62_08900 [Deltaproteobacteria bacterium 37-65-8]
MDPIKSAATDTPKFSLIVIRPFFDREGAKSYSAGDEIKDAATVAAILSSEMAGNCNKVAA